MYGKTISVSVLWFHEDCKQGIEKDKDNGQTPNKVV